MDDCTGSWRPPQREPPGVESATTDWSTAFREADGLAKFTPGRIHLVPLQHTTAGPPGMELTLLTLKIKSGDKVGSQQLIRMWSGRLRGR